jgi:hypothetical protein
MDSKKKKKKKSEHMLDSLYQFAAGAGNLFLGVAGVETLGVLSCESMSCGKA